MRCSVCEYVKSADSEQCEDARPFTMLELPKTICQLKNKKAPGPDFVYTEVLKHLSVPLCQEILSLANLIWTTDAMPSSFT